MPSPQETIRRIVNAPTWDQRVARIRQIPAQHGTSAHPAIYAEVARQLYVPHLAPDFAYVPVEDFYELPHFNRAYAAASEATAGFTRVTVADLAAAIEADPAVLLPLRVITGLLRNEFAGATKLVAETLRLSPLSASKVDSMERSGTATSAEQARVAAETLDQIMQGTLFGSPPGNLKSKQRKPDTQRGWESVQRYAAEGVPYSVFLHQRHYGGAFRQVLDATSELRGDLIEDAVEALFKEHDILYIRTGSHNQAEIADRFEVTVQPAPDFVVYDESDNLRAMLECKGANDGGTARDKALRFERLHDESVRLGGIPLMAVLGGLGWTRVNDTLGPVVRDCDGRVFSVSNLPEMLTVAPFTSLAPYKEALPGLRAGGAITASERLGHVARTYWLHLFTVETWKEFQDHGGDVTGFSEKHWRAVQKIEPGDYMLCYLTRVSRWVGVLEVVGEPFFDEEPIWRSQVFPSRLPVRAVVALPPEHAVPVLDMREQLTIFQGLEHPTRWQGPFRTSPTRWTPEDGEAVLRAVQSAKDSLTERA